MKKTPILETPEEKIKEEGNAYLCSGATVRTLVPIFNKPRATIHSDLKYKLPYIDKALARRVNKKLVKNRLDCTKYIKRGDK